MPSPFKPEDVQGIREEIDAKSMQQRPAESPEEARERILREHEAAIIKQGEQLSHVPDPPSKPSPRSIPAVKPSKEQSIINQCARSGEPIFILRAKDIFSVMVIKEYLDIVEDYGPEDLNFQKEVVDKLNEFKTWQKENVAKVRYPD